MAIKFQTQDPRYIYHLERTRERFGYEETTGVVVIARDSVSARRLAASVCGSEGEGPWLTNLRSGDTAKIRKVGLARVPNGHPPRSRVVCVEGTGA